MTTRIDRDRFSAVIEKIGINPYVEPPGVVLTSIFKAAGRDKGRLPVSGSINEAEFIQTLVKYAGAWRLYINGKMLSDSGLNVGDTADIQIAYDPRPRDTPVPAVFQKVLDSDLAATQAFESLPPSRKKEILRYLGNLKTSGSLERNIDRVMQQLRGEDVGKPHVAMRRK